MFYILLIITMFYSSKLAIYLLRKYTNRNIAKVTVYKKKREQVFFNGKLYNV